MNNRLQALLHHSVVSNHSTIDHTCRLFGSEHVKDVEPMMAGEDFSFYLQKIPGAFIFLGHYTDELQNSAALHNPHFTLHEDVLSRGAAYHAALATQFLNQGGFPDAECKDKKEL